MNDEKGEYRSFERRTIFEETCRSFEWIDHTFERQITT